MVCFSSLVDSCRTDAALLAIVDVWNSGVKIKLRGVADTGYMHGFVVVNEYWVQAQWPRDDGASSPTLRTA